MGPGRNTRSQMLLDTPSRRKHNHILDFHQKIITHVEGLLKSAGYAAEVADEDRFEPIYDIDKPKTEEDRARHIRTSPMADLKAETTV